jgi:hypothetical protein
MKHQRDHLGKVPYELWVYILLALSILAVYAPVLRHDFINYDDPDYVTQNLVVQSGLTPQGLKWAFFNLHGEHTYWHPVTWISHMLDVQLFGLNPGAHHAVNVLFHAANSLLLLLLLHRLTGAFWRSAAVSFLFAFHPLQLDTVAWITERKNVLSTLFWLLTLLAYVRYVKTLSWKDYVSVVLLYAVGLMCKPALVTLPCVLLLLDLWPLRRFAWSKQHLPSGDANSGGALPPEIRSRSVAQLLWEKAPLLVLALAVSMMIVTGHQQIRAHFDLPLSWRVGNAVVSYSRYLGKIFWPDNLSVFYPHPGLWPTGYILGSSLLLFTVSLYSLLRLRRAPWLLVGWLWFLGTLVPMIGLVQAGVQAMADRFVYVPVIGLFAAMVWLVADLAQHCHWPKWAPAALALLAIGSCVVVTSIHLPLWQNSLRLFQHALEVTRGNYVAHYSLGNALADQGKPDEAMRHWEEALQLAPDLAELHARIAAALAQAGDFSGAIAKYRQALKVDPKETGVLNNLAWLLATAPDAQVRNGAEAVELAERACALTQNRRTVFVGTLAAAYAEAGRFEEATASAERACKLADGAGENDLLKFNERLLRYYRARQPYHEPGSSGPRK